MCCLSLANTGVSQKAYGAEVPYLTLSFLALLSIMVAERVCNKVPRSVEKLTTVKLKQNSEEGLMELLHTSRLARQIRALLRG